MKASPELVSALTEILDKISRSIPSEYRGPPIKMYLAGGIAVNFYCGTRYTEDVDASFSKRLLLNFKEMTANYTRKDGEKSFLFLDPNYNSSFGLFHEDYEEDSVEWTNLGNETRKIHLYVLTPLDLAISKLGRFSAQDEDDILALAAEKLFTSEQLEKRTLSALPNYIGDTRPVRANLLRIKEKLFRLYPPE